MEVKNLLLILAIVFSIIASASMSSAIGVTPARTTMGFAPGMSKTVSFSIINSEHKDMQLAIFVQGELNQSVQIGENQLSMSSTDDSKQLNYTITLPSSLSPGQHTADIVVLELPQRAAGTGAFVGSAVAVVTQLVVNVPYPGKYASADLNIIPDAAGGDTTFVIPVVNLGKLDLANVQANIDIFDSSGKKVDSFNTADVAIQSGQRSDIVTKWHSNAPPGKYKAVATLVYDGNTLSLEREFDLGSAALKVVGIDVNNFKLGDIAKLDMKVDNSWSEPVLGVYTQTQVFDSSNQVMADFKSPTYDLKPESNTTMTSYWDTSGVGVGTYQTKLSLIYGDRSTQQNFQFKVGQNSIEAVGLGYVISESKAPGGSSFSTLIITGIVILILINAAWFLFVRKKLMKK